MKLFRYWAVVETTIKDDRGRPYKFRKWGGSNESTAEAKEIAQSLIRMLAARLTGTRINKMASYDYFQRDIPEEIIGEATEATAVTRNRLGCLVLNTTVAMFVDVDLPLGRGLVAKIFGKTEEKYIKRFEDWIKQHAGTGARIYRTAAGLRYLFTHAPVKPDERAIAWLGELGSDRLYTRLCKAQNCYRARLTPKPWRIKMRRLENRFPRETPQQDAAFRKWLADYEQKGQNFAVCKFLKSVGSPLIHEDLAVIMQDHDRAAKANGALPLA